LKECGKGATQCVVQKGDRSTPYTYAQKEVNRMRKW
jgi:hypothetical protein